MIVDATLAALTAGLDEDERIARAAAELDAEGASWRVRKFRDEGMYVFGDNQSAPPGGKFGFEEDAQTEHIAHFDPKRALCQVEAIREVLELHSRGRDEYCAVCYDYNTRESVLWPCPTVRALAGIYTEEKS